jgi:glycopeptide antibiotics resistance protein
MQAKMMIGIVIFLSQVLFLFLLPTLHELTSYLHSVVLFVVWVCYTFVILFFLMHFTNMKIKLSIKFFNFLMLIYAFCLLLLLFSRKPHAVHMANLVPFQTIIEYLFYNQNLLIPFYNLAANIGLFIPFGLYYCYTKSNASLIVLATLTIMAIGVIEVLQFVTRRGSLDIDDLLLNLLGVMIGYFLYPLFSKVFVR